MNKYCQNCGTELTGTETFCANCGAQINTNYTQENNESYQNNNYNGAPFVQNRNLVMAVLLSFISCGIYSIYWFVVMTDEVAKVSNDSNMSGIKAFLFSLITCGIYQLYWYYKMGKNLYLAGRQYNKNISDNSILYLLLGVFGLGIVSYCLMQLDLNKFSE